MPPPTDGQLRPRFVQLCQPGPDLVRVAPIPHPREGTRGRPATGRRALRRGLAACAVSALVALGAAVPAPAMAAGDLNGAVRLANSLFPSVPKRCGGVHIEIGLLSSLNAGASAESYFLSCRVRYAPRTLETATNAQLCSLTVHEWGHLAGLEHSSDPNDFMYPTVPHNPVCGPSDNDQALAGQATQGELVRRREAVKERLSRLRDEVRAVRRAHRRARGARAARIERRIKRLRSRIRRLQSEYKALKTAAP